MQYDLFQGLGLEAYLPLHFAGIALRQLPYLN